MFNYFKRFRSSERARPLDWMVISPDARVSTDQSGAAFLHTRSGIVFTSNHIGAHIWQGLAASESAEAIAARISREHGVERDRVYRDAAQFIGELETHGFVSRKVKARL